MSRIAFSLAVWTLGLAAYLSPPTRLWADPADPTSPVHAAQGLLQRLLPEHVGQFTFEQIATANERDVFELESVGDRIVVRGNNGVSLAMGLNWYLKYYGHCHVSWCGQRLDLPATLPAVTPKVRRVAWARHRYFLNYCCFGYSLPFWDWHQWERLIDWMALNGVNLPLSVTGQEAVWQAVCHNLGMTDTQIAEFLAGPPFLPFQWMGCLDGWGGPLPGDWIARHEELQKQILARQRELGMTPVLQGFTGHVPPALKQQFPAARLHTIRWIEWETSLLDPLDPLFARIARLYTQEQTKRFGTDHYYAADTFIEMTPPSGELAYLEQLSKAIYGGMVSTDPNAVWVLQGWAFMSNRSFWTQPRIAAFLAAIPDERMVILDLYCETKPMWDQTEGFFGKPWLWCNVQNFGCTVSLGGALDRNNAGLCAARQAPHGQHIAGLGFVNEGLGYNPVVYDQMFEMAWRDGPVDWDPWLADFSRARYGRHNPHAEAAWRIQKETVYAAPCRTRSIIDRVPSLQPAGGTPYDNTRLATAWMELQAAADELADSDAYRFDLVNIARQVLSNHASVLHQKIVAAYRARDLETFRTASTAYLHLIGELDQLLASRREFLLGTWHEDARRWGTTDAERNRLEWNARRVLTLWGTGPAIDDYARKEWAGLLGDYYHHRWQWYLNEVGQALQENRPFDEPEFRQKLRPWMEQWSDQHERYSCEPQGDSVALASALWQKYQADFRPDSPSLTTGKPVSCSHALAAYPAWLANDGFATNTDRYWATDIQQSPDPVWWQVDLQQPTTVGRVVVIAYYGDERHYGFTVETSLDGTDWELVADRRANTSPSTSTGYSCGFTPRRVRYIRITQTSNSANTGRHLVEVLAFPDQAAPSP